MRNFESKIINFKSIRVMTKTSKFDTKLGGFSTSFLNIFKFIAIEKSRRLKTQALRNNLLRCVPNPKHYVIVIEMKLNLVEGDRIGQLRFLHVVSRIQLVRKTVWKINSKTMYRGNKLNWAV